MEPREQIVVNLVEFQKAHLAAAERRVAEAEEERSELNDLLIRARDAGLKNSEIAAVLNGAEEEEAESRGEEAALLMPGRWSTQAITTLLRDADSAASHAVDRLIRGDTPDDD
ncbi:MAG: hypothetical protein M3P18_23665 [Actinomycetota bacterium]|nr:hypothetical protein [Actinomycetota bacterium]